MIRSLAMRIQPMSANRADWHHFRAASKGAALFFAWVQSESIGTSVQTCQGLPVAVANEG